MARWVIKIYFSALKIKIAHRNVESALKINKELHLEIYSQLDLFLGRHVAKCRFLNIYNNALSSYITL